MDAIIDLLALASEFEQRLPELPAPLDIPQGGAIAAWIDHTLLKPEATADQVKTLCQEARQYSFATVCVNPAYVPLCVGLLAGSSVGVCTVVGFPLGATLPTQKVVETLSSLSAGATEIDMVINVGALKSQAYGQVLNEIQAVVQIAHNQRSLVKVILEMALLNHQEKIIACLLCQHAGADFVKTSTGFGPWGAKVEDVELMYRIVGTTTRVKAAGGIRSYTDARGMIQAGASRLGSSAGVLIMNEAAG